MAERFVWLKPVRWALWSMPRFVLVVGILWAIAGALVIASYEASYGHKTHLTEIVFGVIAGFVGGVVWAFLMWKLVITRIRATREGSR